MSFRVICCLLLASSFALAGPDSGNAEVERLGWMSGCWVMDDGREKVEELWMKPAGGSMLGLSRTVKDGHTVFIEYAQVVEAAHETSYVVSLGMGKRPVSFKLLRISDSEVVFENAAHDFPQRVIYRRESSNALFARVEGKENGIEKGYDFRYRRCWCN
jgi:hypothetical protein